MAIKGVWSRMLDLCIFNYFYVLFKEVISQGNYSNFAVITFFYTCKNRTYVLNAREVNPVERKILHSDANSFV